MNKQSSYPVLRFALGLVLLFSLILGDITPSHASGVCYVKTDASGQNDGSSWMNAYTSLQSALGASPCTEVWVAAGTYTPTQGTNRTISFVLKNGVSLYGGKGKVLWVVGGALFITLIDNSLNMLGFSHFTIMMIKGGVILIAAASDRVRATLTI